MISIRQAILTLDVTERQIAPLVCGAQPFAGVAALGTLVARVVTTVLDDRRCLRSWLAPTTEASA